MHLLTLVETMDHCGADPLVDARDNLLHELFVRDSRWITKLPREAHVSLALTIPILFLAPVLKLLEQF